MTLEKIGALASRRGRQSVGCRRGRSRSSANRLMDTPCRGSGRRSTAVFNKIVVGSRRRERRPLLPIEGRVIPAFINVNFAVAPTSCPHVLTRVGGFAIHRVEPTDLRERMPGVGVPWRDASGRRRRRWIAALLPPRRLPGHGHGAGGIATGARSITSRATSEFR